MNKWDVHHRGITVNVIALSAWLLARDDVPGTGWSRTFAEHLIDSEEDRALLAVLVWMLRDADR
jgi:hypothetical protein